MSLLIVIGVYSGMLEKQLGACQGPFVEWKSSQAVRKTVQIPRVHQHRAPMAHNNISALLVPCIAPHDIHKIDPFVILYAESMWQTFEHDAIFSLDKGPSRCLDGSSRLVAGSVDCVSFLDDAAPADISASLTLAIG